ncbi:MAG TPA: ABC transporter substrate-binding protein [Burkholderiaceae bacterium]|nr:ABC transporter substrate-binding protein [Burkholderiaceae bacterium]
MKRRDCLAAGLALQSTPALGSVDHPGAPAAAPKPLRTAFNFAETGFDPAQVSDPSSHTVNAHIFESPLTYDYLARPVRLRPQTAVALPEVSSDFRRFVFTIQPGIDFADDPVFKGQPRELTADDYVYSIKRFYNPRVKTEHLDQFENAQVLGLRSLDRYRFEIRLAQPQPRFIQVFASPQFAGALAREVVEAYADDLMARPVGTGPFMLAQWRRGSFIRLQRNPRFRTQVFDAKPAPDDAAGQAIARQLAGRRLPLLDQVEVQIIDESKPRWLAYDKAAEIRLVRGGHPPCGYSAALGRPGAGRAVQRRTLHAGRFRPAVRTPARPARWARASGRHAGGHATDAGLPTLHRPQPPHRHRPHAGPCARLPAPPFHAGLVALCRHRVNKALVGLPSMHHTVDETTRFCR